MNMENNFSTFEEISDMPRYQGRWVVILNKKVVAAGTAKKIKEKMMHIRKEHPKEIPLIAKVPKKILQIV